MTWLSQLGEMLWRAWAYVSTGRTLAIILGIGFAVLAVFLLIASRTRWGQAKPLTKCVVLSVLAHVWLLMYALGSREILPQGDSRSGEKSISVAFDAGPAWEPLPSTAHDASESAASEQEPPAWEAPVPLADLPKPELLESVFRNEAIVAPPDLLPPLEATPMPALPPPEALADASQAAAVSEDSQSFDSSAELPGQPGQDPVDVAQPPATPGPMDPPQLAAGPPPSPVTRPLHPIASERSPILPPESQLPDHPTLPREYQLRQAPNRLQLSQAYGADADSEAAVAAGLQWLAAAQSQDGSWNAKKYGGGTETHALGEYRYSTGDRADTGISGLALLAFLSAGHTHLEGEHRRTVQLGLQYLLQAQMPSGDLSGPKQVGSEPSVMNARMYCHSIATLALAEAYAMTHDAFLKDSLLRAAQYSINAQDVRGGGWRYRPRDPGDLSQFGWQAMALASVARSGIQVPVEVQRRMRRFLDACAAGQHGGLARYRPQEGRPSETMTAEAFACRMLLDYPMTLDAQVEATRMLMTHQPGQSEDNVYYWYYATLALFQLQDENWRVWNQALKSRLLASQVPAYDTQAGSWHPDALWGGYGGRVYSTAMSCLCLEVYYRYLPMYQRANLAQQPQPNQFSR